jgi:hypothetical protein
MSESRIVLGLVVAPGPLAEVTAELAVDLTALLEERLPGADWHIDVLIEELVVPPADDGELVDALRRRLLNENWDLSVLLTDLPLAIRGRPVVAHASPLHGVAVLSVPALGAVGVRRRVRDAVLQLIQTLVADGEPDEAAPDRRGLHRRVRALGLDTDAAHELGTVRFTRRVLGANLRLLAGMVRTNQPWRLALRLSRALVGAAAVGVFALLNSDIWRTADRLGWVRLVVVGLVGVAVTTATLVIGGGLWERAHGRAARQQVVLFNVATTTTVLLGVLSLYGVLLVLAAVSAGGLVVPGLLATALQHPVGLADFAQVAWLAGSLALVGGALGAGLESDDAVREAAYTYRPGRTEEG